MAGSTVTYATQTDLGHDAGVQQLDPAVKAALFSSLYDHGVYDAPYPSDDGRRAWFQQGDFTGPLQTNIQILETTNTTSVTTDDAPDALKAIIMKGAGHELDVHGGKHDEFIAMGKGETRSSCSTRATIRSSAGTATIQLMRAAAPATTRSLAVRGTIRFTEVLGTIRWTVVRATISSTRAARTPESKIFFTAGRVPTPCMAAAARIRSMVARGMTCSLPVQASISCCKPEAAILCWSIRLQRRAEPIR